MVRYFCLLLSLLLVFSGCASRSGKNQTTLFREAEAMRVAASDIKDASGKAMQELEHIHTALQAADKAVGQAVDNTPTETAPLVLESLSVARLALGEASVARDSVSTEVHKVHAIAGGIKESADKVTKSANHVEDVPSFWDRLTTSIRRLILIALGLVVIIIGWRFGLDKIVKSFLAAVSTGINTASDWAYSKYEGPAKLVREGKMDEAIAALRSAVPGLDKTFKRGGSTDA